MSIVKRRSSLQNGHLFSLRQYKVYTKICYSPKFQPPTCASAITLRNLSQNSTTERRNLGAGNVCVTSKSSAWILAGKCKYSKLLVSSYWLLFVKMPVCASPFCSNRAPRNTKNKEFRPLKFSRQTSGWALWRHAYISNMAILESTSPLMLNLKIPQLGYCSTSSDVSSLSVLSSNSESLLSLWK